MFFSLLMNVRSVWNISMGTGKGPAGQCRPLDFEIW